MITALWWTYIIRFHSQKHFSALRQSRSQFVEIQNVQPWAFWRSRFAVPCINCNSNCCLCCAVRVLRRLGHTMIFFLHLIIFLNTLNIYSHLYIVCEFIMRIPLNRTHATILQFPKVCYSYTWLIIKMNDSGCFFCQVVWDCLSYEFSICVGIYILVRMPFNDAVAHHSISYLNK